MWEEAEKYLRSAIVKAFLRFAIVVAVEALVVSATMGWVRVHEPSNPEAQGAGSCHTDM